MNNEVYKEVYGHILNDAQRIRKEIMSEWGDILMFGGSMPEDVVNELSTAARITGLAFDALSNHDVSFEQVANKPDLFRLTVREESYVCHKSAIPSMSGFLDVVNVPGVPSSTFENSRPVKENPVEQEDLEPALVEENSEEIEEIASSSNPWDTLEDENEYEFIETESDNDGDIKNKTEYEDDENKIPSVSFEADEDDEDDYEIEEDNEGEDQSASDSKIAFEEDDNNALEDEEDKEDEEEVAATPVIQSRKAEIIGGTAQVASIAKRDLFIEEAQKNRSDFIYDMYQVNLTHSGYAGGGKPEELLIMVAPLKLSRFATVSVPIIVSVYHKGKIISKSSYDQAEEGKNIVMLDVDEFYLLFRGSIEADGKFKVYISTTGISANQGDILNISSSKSYGDTNSRTVNNGHIKIRSMVDDEEGTIEVFPFGDPEDDEFIVMTRNDEFVDYLYISDAVKGLKKAIIFQGDQKSQVLCSWDEDHEQMFLELKKV